MASEKVKSYKNTKKKLEILSWFLCFGMTCIYVLLAIISPNSDNKQAESAIMGDIKSLLVKIILIIIPMIVLTIIVGNKMKPTVWMVNIILSNLIVGNWMMYITFIVWLIDSYIISKKISEYNTRIITRTEMER